MVERPYNLLFLCTGDATRSIFGECMVKRFGRAPLPDVEQNDAVEPELQGR
jgi:protein-tyrosine-phosphatase